MNNRSNIRSRTWKVQIVSAKEVTPTKDAKRKMLKVQFPNRRKQTDKGRGRAFYVDIPKHFFDGEGTFTANPPYDKGELIDIQWTGWGKYSGWIDINTQQRGAGGGGGDTTSDCTKWS